LAYDKERQAADRMLSLFAAASRQRPVIIVTANVVNKTTWSGFEGTDARDEA
jgi:hypothetical protein